MNAPDPAREVQDRVRRVVDAALDRKALDLRVLGLEGVCDFADYFVICSGASGRQVAAIADGVGDRLIAHRAKPLHVEGKRASRWILMDYGDFLVHVFDPERRAHFRLEEMWSDALDLTDLFVDSETGAGIEEDRSQQGK